MCVSLFCSHDEKFEEFEGFEGFEKFIDSMFYIKTLGITVLKVI